MTTFLSPPFRQSIRRLLRRSAKPYVKVAPSQLEGAGRGVFTNIQIEQGTPICLYPGIFSPGLPRAFSDATFLGGAGLPSGVRPPETNAYIMNLKNVGGYIDGLATSGCDDDKSNPHAIGHLVNHSSHQPNVEVFSFWWHEVCTGNTEDECDEEVMANNNITHGGGRTYGIPNSRRCDGTPWFFHNGEIKLHEKGETTPCAGAVFCALRGLNENEEIYLDYGLQEPLPVWAKGWYHC